MPFNLLKMKSIIFSPLLFILIGCAPPLENKCYSMHMGKWESGTLLENETGAFRHISNENADGFLEKQYYPDTSEGKTLFQSQAWSKCTKN